MFAADSGYWRSLVARILGVDEVVGSNPAYPIWQTINKRLVFDLAAPSSPLGWSDRCRSVGLLHEGGERMVQRTEGEYFVIKAKENGVQVIGLTRGQDTRFHHTEKLDKGEVMIAQFTDHTSAVKVRGKAEILTKHGRVDTEG